MQYEGITLKKLLSGGSVGNESLYIVELSLKGKAWRLCKPSQCVFFFKMKQHISEVMYQTRESVFHRDIQTTRRELKIRGAAEHFWRHSKRLDSEWNTVSSVWLIMIREPDLLYSSDFLCFCSMNYELVWEGGLRMLRYTSKDVAKCSNQLILLHPF